MKHDAFLMKDLLIENESKIIMLVLDGVGDIHTPESPRTSLELASTPNLDALARVSVLGRHMPISMGITPGSGPAHLALFGYNPTRKEYDAGRGVLESLGIDFDLLPSDVAIRGNFASRDASGFLTDRRAGRIPTSECDRLCGMLQEKVGVLDGVEIIVRPVKDYRFALILRGEGLSPLICETDPQKTGLKPVPPTALDPEASKTEVLLQKLVETYNKILADEPRANTVLLRGISRLPTLESMWSRFGLRPAAIATYPLYRGVAKLVGMELMPMVDTIEEEFRILQENFAGPHNFFFIHIKRTDSYGEDGNQKGKIEVIEEVDRYIPVLRDLNPAVLMVTGDHSTPHVMKSHSWHPVPFMLHGPFCDLDGTEAFNETECDRGRLGIFPTVQIMPLALASAGRLLKFGA
ncbi:MAG: 2,3-bisphosphoglycerate-independent phosphoglycerate mutase [Deltaproteobacteria bacterium]|nr:2,3-bisphosphoglycerate-independent phosphoglycerate mutase [Deltaproteobacteria bacterium]